MCVCISGGLKGLRKGFIALPLESLSSADGRGPKVALSGLSSEPEPLFLPQQRALRPGAVPGLQTVPGRSVGGGGVKLGVLVAEDSHLEGKLPLLSWGSVTAPPWPPIIFTLITLMMMNLQLSFLPPA